MRSFTGTFLTRKTRQILWKVSFNIFFSIDLTSNSFINTNIYNNISHVLNIHYIKYSIIINLKGRYHLKTNFKRTWSYLPQSSNVNYQALEETISVKLNSTPLSLYRPLKKFATRISSHYNILQQGVTW